MEAELEIVDAGASRVSFVKAFRVVFLFLEGALRGGGEIFFSLGTRKSG
jgi:hypothetical protein